MGPDQERQPWLHDLVLTLAAPTQVWSPPDGQMRGHGLDGLLHGDRRLLSRLELLLDGQEPTPTAHYDRGGDRHVFVSVPRHLGGQGHDPTVRVTRVREVEPGAMRERVTVSSYGGEPVRTRLTLLVAADLLPVDRVKAGRRGDEVAPALDGDAASWSADGLRGTLRAPGATPQPDGSCVQVSWDLDVLPGESATRELVVTVEDPTAVVTAPDGPPEWGGLTVESEDRRLAPALDRALADLRLLRLAPPDSPGEEFLGAGAPWFLTLFGRDSLWAARMLLPTGTSLAASTLRVLAARQGTKVDVDAAEEPGKILHEIRGAAFSLDDDHTLPPVYYGTVDATPLWALTLHDAWRWGLEPEQVEQLLPALERALGWMAGHGDADGDHLLEYHDRSGHGLVNQGWKDSPDALRHLDGSIGHAPVALSEVQGYAHAAAVAGADLLEAFGRPGTDRWRTWAAGLRAEFHRRFWVEDAVGAFPAIALDGDKRPVVSLTSNIGHLLGTGLLDPEQVERVAQRLASTEMLSGFGIRTLSKAAAGYSPTGYHVGSVWPHDTAICLAGLAAERRPEVVPVAEALLATLDAFDGRPPELLAGDGRDEHPVPIPYPASCRPQAWSAASAVALVAAVTGLRPTGDGTLTAEPVSPWPWGRTRFDGLRVGTRSVAMTVDEHGTASST